MPIMEISIVPVGTKRASLSSYVAEAIKVLRTQKGIKYTLTAMGTIIEARSLKQLFDIAHLMHSAILRGNVTRVVTSIKIDDRKDKKITMHGKTQSVQRKLGHI